jgi:uncharacterized protein YifN (PemK superfamily)
MTEALSFLQFVPDRARIIVVNFEMGGSAVPPEMWKSGRPCVVIQNNKLVRSDLVTVIPLSTKIPEYPQQHHHKMDHRSFRDMPAVYGGQGLERWAKCDYITTVSLSRCLDPHYKPNYGDRRYVKVKAIQADMDAIDQCLIWTLRLGAKTQVTV